MSPTAWTALAFVAATALAVLVHVRRSSRAAGPHADSVPCCPRCGTRVPGGSRFCPGCGIPSQIFEVAAARAVSAEERAAQEDSGKLHAIVRADVCVGCGACVPVCPREQAIRLEGKLAIVDRERCTGEGKCAEACPVGGIVLSTGAAVHRVEVPDVRSDFQSNVPGVYVVGELGGRGLIKNAVNEGKVAAENVARELAGAGGAEVRTAAPGVERIFDVAIVGSGPAGLSAGLEAHRAGLDYVILEQGTLADTIRKYPRHKLLLAEPVKVPLYGDLWIADASKETLLRVWETIIERTGLEVRTEHRVQAVERDGEAIVVRGDDFAVRARRVILALGRRGTPRRLGVPGEESDKVFYDIVEMDAFRGKRVLVVGGGDSALESAVGLAAQRDTEVVLSYRGADFGRAKPRNVTKLEEAERSGAVRVLRGSVVRSIEPDSVVLETNGETVTLPIDHVIVRIGGEPPSRFLEKVGIRSVVKELPLEEARDAVGV